MSILKIKEAIDDYNDKRREKGEPKMTQRSLSEVVLDDLEKEQAEFYMSRWCHGKSLGKLTPNHIVIICYKTGVSPNFLFDWEETQIG